MVDICDGCTGAIYSKVRTRSCAIKDMPDYVDNCPCTNCLIKVVCFNVCPERMSYYQKMLISKYK